MKQLHPLAVVALVRLAERCGVELSADGKRGRIVYRPRHRLPDSVAAQLGGWKWSVIRYLEDRSWLDAALDCLHPDDESDLTDVILETYSFRTIELQEPAERAALIALSAGRQWLADKVANGMEWCRKYVEERLAARRRNPIRTDCRIP